MRNAKYWGVAIGLAVLCVAVFIGCAQMATPTGVSVGSSLGNSAGKLGSVVEVFYGTDRNLISASDSAVEFGIQRSSNLFYGSCLVNVPANHKVGIIERPWFKWTKENPERHMMLVGHKGYQNFAEFVGAIKTQPKEKMFVFIHGYNVNFKDAALRTGQMAYDLQFEGTPVFFSWPSSGAVLSYARDENNIEWATKHIIKFLDGLIKDVPTKDIYIIAHSMGTRGASRAITAVLESNPEAAGRIKEVVLAAPDIDADVFKDQIMPVFSKAELPVTMYASDKDKALKLSSWLHGYVRVGSGSSGMKNLEVIDASEGDMDFLGHSYFAENVPIINDLHYLVEKSFRADSRFMLKRVDTSDGPYWVLKK